MLKAIPNIAKKMLVVLIAALFVVSMMFFALPGKIYGATTNVNPGDSIQAAIDAAVAGDTIIVAAGTYTEQIIINKNLTLQGVGGPVIKVPASPVAFQFTESGAKWKPVVLAFGGTNSSGSISGADTITVNISGFVIDGNNQTPTSGYRSAGILLRNAGGTISDNTVQRMYIDGAETFGIIVYGNSNIVISNNNVSGYARCGIGANGDSNGISVPNNPTPNAVIESNTVTGPGMGVPVTWAPNGIQIGWGAKGKVIGNSVSGNGYPGTDWTGSGIIIAMSDNVEVDNNTVIQNQTGISVAGYMWDSNGVTANGNLIYGNTVDKNTYGISIQDKSVNTTVENNTIKNSDYEGIGLCNFYNNSPTGTVIKYNTITSNNTKNDPGSGGIWIDDDVDADKVNINFNNIVDNKQFGLLNKSATNSINAINNWWGDASGPTHSSNPNGTGDAVSDNVNFTPWLTNPVGYVAPTPPKPLTPEEQAALDLSIQQQVAAYGASNVGFTKTLYDNILGRASDEEGLNDWVTALNEGKITLGDLVFGFVFSKELEPVISPAGPEEFINFLYNNVLNREPDPDGFNNWLTLMQSGMTKQEVLLHFVDSDEFNNICEMFGLNP